MLLEIPFMCIPIEKEKVQIGNTIILDWLGLNQPDDLRIGKVESFNESFPVIRNQYGNLSIPTEKWKDVKYYLVQNL